MVAIVLVLKRPAPQASPAAGPTVTGHAQSPNARTGQGPETDEPQERTKPGAGEASAPSQSGGVQAQAAPAAPAPKSDANSEAISAMVAKTLAGGNVSAGSSAGSGEQSGPNIKDQQVTMDGDIVHGRFLTEIGGKDVWVTVSGRMGEKDGYATFDPTEFKVGDTEVPVALVNPLLQKKMAEERDRLKVPSAPQ